MRCELTRTSLKLLVNCVISSRTVPHRNQCHYSGRTMLDVNVFCCDSIIVSVLCQPANVFMIESQQMLLSLIVRIDINI